MNAAHHLSIDLETYSSEDIAKSGLYRYAQSPDFEILLLAYSLDGAPVEVLDLTAGQAIPPELQRMLFDPTVIKHAFNAAFEWYCLSRHFGLKEQQMTAWLSQWHCTMAHCRYCGYPGSLAAAGPALGLPEDKQKLAVGRALIQYFCKPCKPTKTNGGRLRNLPRHAPEKWALFIDYNRQDVVTEMEIEKRLEPFPMPGMLLAEWVLDQTINLRGVQVDMELVSGALELVANVQERYLEEAKTLTQLENPNSVSKLIGWLNKEGLAVDNLRKATVKELLGGNQINARIRRVLELRQELSKTSTKKYDTLETVVCADGRVRGTLQFYGAGRTGRWSGRLAQLQNLPRTYIDPALLPLARKLARGKQEDALRLIFGSVPDTLSQLIRTAFVATPGHTLVDADFSAIEARVVAWLAEEEWVLEVFRTHGKIYEATASQLYGVPIERIAKGNPEYALRQKGKAATLALGYGGGPPALIKAGGLPKDTPEEELIDIRDRWRQANPAIVQFWRTVDAASRESFETGRTVELRGGSLTFARECSPELDYLTIRLPSGRKLYYAGPHWGTNRFGQPALRYWGVNQSSRKWEEMETYGGKLTENITQAVARDCLSEALMHLERAGYPVVFHIHDEVVVDTPQDGETALREVIRIMSQTPAWAAGLPLRADGWTGNYFRKD